MSECLPPTEQPPARRLLISAFATSIVLAGCGLQVETTTQGSGLVSNNQTTEVAPEIITLPSRAPNVPKTPQRSPKAQKVLPHVSVQSQCERITTATRRVQAASSLATYTKIYMPLAERVEAACGIPKEVTIAQSYHESDGGHSGLSKNHKNMFGIKARQAGFAGWEGPAYLQKTKEHVTKDKLVDDKSCPQKPVQLPNGMFEITVCDPFRAYHSAEESFMDYGYFLRNRGFESPGEFYADAFKETDPIKFLKAIIDDDDGPAGPQRSYATDIAYVEKVSRYIKAIQWLEDTGS